MLCNHHLWGINLLKVLWIGEEYGGNMSEYHEMVRNGADSPIFREKYGQVNVTNELKSQLV